MKTVKVLLVGASGYARHYITQFQECPDMNAELSAIVDPFVSVSPYLDWIKEKGVPIYHSLEDFYAGGNGADLVVICSPIQFHREHSEIALRHGSAVLCEKPLCASASDAEALLAVWEDTGRLPFGVGFQWSFSGPILALKRDILDGAFGKPLFLKTIVLWPRGDAYYKPEGWKGRRTKNGALINDSVIMNATAHYLHNMLFVLGGAMDTAACPEVVSGSLYRDRDIETFDTCLIQGRFADGCGMLYCASHAAEGKRNPRFEYRFEKGTVYFDDDKDGMVRAVFADGRVKEYGMPQADTEKWCKLLAMLEAARTGSGSVCGIATAIPHLRVCGATLGGMEISRFPAELTVRTEDPAGYKVKGLDAVLERFYETEEMPDKTVASWVQPARLVTL